MLADTHASIVEPLCCCNNRLQNFFFSSLSLDESISEQLSDCKKSRTVLSRMIGDLSRPTRISLLSPFVFSRGRLKEKNRNDVRSGRAWCHTSPSPHVKEFAKTSCVSEKNSFRVMSREEEKELKVESVKPPIVPRLRSVKMPCCFRPLSSFEFFVLGIVVLYSTFHIHHWNWNNVE